MSESLELVRQEPQPIATRSPGVGEMLQTAIDRGLAPESMEKLMDLYERAQDREAEKAFTVAFNALQAEMPVITASTVIPNRGKYERFEDVMAKVGPLLIKHGFAVSFSNSYSDGRVVETCHLKHIGGHSQSNSFAVRLGGRSDSETQADCKAATTAKRNALLNALNIVIRQDCLSSEDDPRSEGDYITPDQAANLKRRVQETASDEKMFLKYAAAESYEKIRSGKFSMLDASLRRKERTA